MITLFFSPPGAQGHAKVCLEPSLSSSCSSDLHILVFGINLIKRLEIRSVSLDPGSCEEGGRHSTFLISKVLTTRKRTRALSMDIKKVTYTLKVE